MVEKRTNNTKKGILIGVGISALLLTGFLGSYAYFMGNLGSNKNEEVSTQAGTLSLTFADGNNGITEALEFGGSIEKTFTIENTGTLDATARIMWDDLINTYINGSLTYTLSSSDTETGTYTNIVENQNVPVSATSTKELLVGNLSIPTGTTKYYKLTITLNYLDDVDQTADLKASLSTHFRIEESNGKDILNAGIETTLAKIGKETRTSEGLNFANAATTDETADGLYSLEDDYGTSYFYRGAVADNYVKFGDYYWRIIRINGNGSVRMIYDGTQAYANGTSSTDRVAWSNQKFNALANDTKYVGYMYGPANEVEGTTTYSTNKAQAQTNTESSTIKTSIENWYETNIKSKGLDEYVSDSVFCYDRTTPGKDSTKWSEDTGLGYGDNVTSYGALGRYRNGTTGTSGLIDKIDIQPKFLCENKNDAFTATDTKKGNGALGQKVGLITADEVVAGGSGKFNTANSSYYLNKENWYWASSPYFYSGIAFVFYVGDNGVLNADFVYRKGGVAPVINLTPEYFATLIGDGTIGNEFRA